jgi:hypothetical protein
MTTNEKKQALLDAGIKLRANASEETVNAAWEEFNNPAPEPEVVEDTPAAPLNPPVATATKTREDINAIIARLGTNRLGDRTPEVVAWARENLTEDEFEARYGGRNLEV